MTELETREHILTIASALIAEKGFDKTSMNDIVRESGISKGGIYWHFKSKDEIIFAIVAGIFAEQIQFLDEVLSAGGRAIERFHRLIELLLMSFESIPEAMPSPLDVYTQAMRKPELRAQLKHYFERYQAHLANLIEQGVQEGDFSVEDAELTAFIFMSSIEGILLMQSVWQSEHALQTALREATTLFLRGIQKNRGD